MANLLALAGITVEIRPLEHTYVIRHLDLHEPIVLSRQDLTETGRSPDHIIYDLVAATLRHQQEDESHIVRGEN